MAESRMMSGSPILSGDNTIPGIKVHKEVKALIPTIEDECRLMGLDFYPVIYEFLTYDQMSEIASYGGFPVRYPHWRFGMEFEEMARGYEHNQYRISEMVINCLHPDAPVLTSQGTISAQNIKINHKVVLNGITRNVVAVVRQPKAKTKKICLRKGQEMICSPNHKWKVLTKNGPDWVETKHLKSGDILLGNDSFNMPIWNTKLEWSVDKVWEETRLASRQFLKEIVPPTEMNLDLAELLGVLIGDGSIGVQGAENNLAVSVGKDNRQYAEYVKSLFYSVFGADAVIQEKPAGLVVLLQSKFAVDFIDSLGIPKGCTYENKRIPHIIWNSHPIFRSAFLKGLFDTDGYATDQLGMSCFNIYLANDVQIMFSEMGIQTILETLHNGTGKHGNELFINVVEIRGQSALRKFQDRIGFSIPYKSDGLKALTSRIYCRGGGIHSDYIQNSIIEWGDKMEITSYNCPSLGRSLYQMKKKNVGNNCIFSFIERAIQIENYDPPSELLMLLKNPMFEVQDVVDELETETIDIALDHMNHDFVAYGLATHNTNPCVIYCMDSNTLVDNVDVIAHAIGHNDFFKNNIFFEPTNENMMNKMANHGTRIRDYIARWGNEVVTEFIDQCLRIDTLIDPSKAWSKKKIKDVNSKDERNYVFADRLHSTHNYMDEWVNTKEYIAKQNKEIERREAEQFVDVFGAPVKDIFGYLKDNAPLKPWQQDIISMLYEEAMYFSPQRATKMINEGWASFVDYYIMCRRGLCSLGQKTEDAGIWHYAEHKMRVLGGKYSQNPYKMGFELLLDIEDRWNKGKFGSEWENCTSMKEKQAWDKKLGLGLEKLFEVRQFYNDYTLIQEFFTPEFCEKKQFFEYKRMGNGEYKIVNRDFKSIKKKLLQRHMNGGLPDIRLTDPNHLGKGWFFMKLNWDGRPLHDPYARETITSVYRLWKNTVILSARTTNGDEFLYVCDGPHPDKNVQVMTRAEYESAFMTSIESTPKS